MKVGMTHVETVRKRLNQFVTHVGMTDVHKPLGIVSGPFLKCDVGEVLR